MIFQNSEFIDPPNIIFGIRGQNFIHLKFCRMHQHYPTIYKFLKKTSNVASKPTFTCALKKNTTSLFFNPQYLRQFFIKSINSGQL